MAKIEALPEPNMDLLRAMPDDVLVAQELVQQGGIHAIAFLLKYGASEENAAAMLASLRENAQRIRTVMQERGMASAFNEDQTEFS